MNSSDAEKRLKSFVRVLDTTGLGRGMTQAIRLAPYDRKLSFIFKYAPAISIVPCIGFYFAFLPFMPPFSMTVVVEIAIALGQSRRTKREDSDIASRTPHYNA